MAGIAAGYIVGIAMGIFLGLLMGLAIIEKQEMSGEERSARRRRLFSVFLLGVLATMVLALAGVL